MLESPFSTVNQVLNETSNGYDDLRIIAKDRGGKFRVLLQAAADELETSQRTLVQTYAQLVETQQKLVAVNDQLLALRAKAYQGIPMTTGVLR